MHRNHSFGSLLIRKYQPSPLATVLEALPAKLVVQFGLHWIRDTNHIAADQPFAASKQDNNDAEATVSNSSLKHDHQKRGDDESTFEHVHVPLGKYPSGFLEQMKQQKLREMRIKYDQLQTRTCGAEEDGDQVETDFGQTDFGHRYPTDFGQTDFGQTDFGQTDFGQTDFGQNRLWPKPTLAKPTLAKPTLAKVKVLDV